MMKLDILVRIGGFHLRARAETSPGMDRVTPTEPIAPCAVRGKCERKGSRRVCRAEPPGQLEPVDDAFVLSGAA
jgi:hypothetical protein